MPCSMFARKRIDDRRQRQRARITGCIRSGKRCAEKNTPDTIHIGIMIEFVSPDTSSIVRTRDAISSPSELEAQRPNHAQRRETHNRPAHRHSEHQNPEAQQRAHLHHQQRQSREQERYQILMLR